MRHSSPVLDAIVGFAYFFIILIPIMYTLLVHPIINACNTQNFVGFSVAVAIDCVIFVCIIAFALKSHYKKKFEEALRQEKINHRIAIDNELMGMPQRLDEIMTDLIRAKKKLFDGYRKMEFEPPTSERPYSTGASIEGKIRAMEWDIAELLRTIEAVDKYTRRNEKMYNVRFMANIHKTDETVRAILDCIYPDSVFLAKAGFAMVSDEALENMEIDEKEQLRKLYEAISKRLEFVENFLKSRQQGGGVPREMQDLRNKIIADTVLERFDFDEIYPQTAQMISQIEVLYLEYMAKQLDWGHDVQRAKKVENLRTIKADTQVLIKKYATYEILFEYLIDAFPILTDYVRPPIRTRVSREDVEKVTEYIQQSGEWLPERFNK